MRSTRLFAFGCVLAASALTATACPGPPAPTWSTAVPLTAGSGVTIGNDWAVGSSSSSDGNIVAFTSFASNLVAGDTNGASDLFIRDRQAQSTVRIAQNVQAPPRISKNARYVGYQSPAGFSVFDRTTSTVQTWTDLPGAAGPSSPLVSDDGLSAVYGVGPSFGGFSTACSVRDMTTGVIVSCPPGNGDGGTPGLRAVSDNARFVVYSWSGFNGPSPTRLWDRSTNTVTMLPSTFLSFFTAGISDDGRYLTTLAAGALPNSYVGARIDLQTNTILNMAANPASNAFSTSISPNGRYVGINTEAALSALDTNGVGDIYVWDTQTGTLRFPALTPAGGAIPERTEICPGSGTLLDDGSTCLSTTGALDSTDQNLQTDHYRR